MCHVRAVRAGRFVPSHSTRFVPSHSDEISVNAPEDATDYANSVKPRPGSMRKNLEVFNVSLRFRRRRTVHSEKNNASR